MISTDFAPIEGPKDAQEAYAQLTHPWTWKKGKHLQRARLRMKKLAPKHEIAFFLSARAGLYKILEALKVGEGHEVITVPFTCEAVIIPILACRAKPVYVDIESDTYSLDCSRLEQAITANTRAIILQHTFGMTPRDRTHIIRVARQKRIPVIEDLAHGFDPTIFASTKPSQTIKLFSFGRSKAISSVWGAAVATPQAQLAQSIKLLERQLDPPSWVFILRSLWYKPLSVLIKKTYNLGIGKLTVGRSLHTTSHMLGLIANELSARERRLKVDMHMIKAYPDAFAALLMPQLQSFERIQSIRSSACSYYSLEFPSSVAEQPLSRFPIVVDHRDTVYNYLAKRSIYVGRWYRRLMGEDSASTCPTAQRIAGSILNLPTNVSLQQAKDIVQQVRNAQKAASHTHAKAAQKKKKKA